MNGSLSNTPLGRYQVLDLIGRGGMGEVYRARDTSLGRDLAIKVLPAELTRDPHRVERFIKEARAASALNHPHLISIYEIGTEPVHYIAMELVHGQTLRAILQSGLPDRRSALDWLLQVCDAVAAAHDAGVVHRDIKPENLIIANDGYAKVLDFGVAKLKGDEVAAADEATRGVLTEAGMMVGTSGYMSPEQARGVPIDRRTDIFSFGCVLYECLTGTRAFDAPSAVERMHRVIRDEPAPLARAPRRVAGARQPRPEVPRERSRRALSVDEGRGHRPPLRAASTRHLGLGAGGDGRASLPRPRLAGVAAIAAAIAIAAWLYQRDADPELAPVATTPIAIERLTTTGDTIDAAISPDGKHLAHVEAIGRRRHWGFSTSSRARTRRFWTLPTLRSESGFRRMEARSISPAAVKTPPRTSPGRRAWRRHAAHAVVGHRHAGDVFARRPADRLSPRAVSGSGFERADDRHVDGGSERVLATRRSPELFAPAFFTGPSWSPDGSVIVAIDPQSRR